MYGGGGNDTLWGSNGNDTIRGGGGRDFIRGGNGIDNMSGGDGDDVFHFRPGDEAPPAFSDDVDRILAFTSGDIIDLSDLTSGLVDYIGSAAFTGIDQVRHINFGGGFRKVQINLAGDEEPELEILVDVSRIGSLAFEDFSL